MPYFTFISYELSFKNSLDKDASAFLHALNRVIVSDEDLNKLTDFIIKSIDGISQSRPRCKPVSVSFYTHDNGDLQLQGFEPVKFFIYKAKN